ncbi:uncharacterized protein LOC125158264 [Prionailurus viverrinus]|uniref:uncharacterized protein LOC125158264 n=1 Tax=Prionailurus viverrinus TaxID=61388 RepID=UPI001FF2AB3F|nr:uncharacterized protein LOC125158264 [Prionailurus viverrinus]
MASRSYPVCSPGSAMAHPSSVVSSPPLPTFPLSVTRPQAVPRSRVLPQTRLFSPAPYSRRTAALTRSAPPREGLPEQRPNVGRSQERPLDPAAAGAPRPRPEASPPQKKLARQASSSVSGMVENGDTRLAPGFTLHDPVPAPANAAAFRGLPGPGGFHSLHRMSFRQRNRLSPCGPSTSRTPLCSWGLALPTRAPPVLEAVIYPNIIPVKTKLFNMEITHIVLALSSAFHCGARDVPSMYGKQLAGTFSIGQNSGVPPQCPMVSLHGVQPSRL